MTPRQRGATFGRAYWQKPHPDVTRWEAALNLVKRDWRDFRRVFLRHLRPAIEQVTRTFNALAPVFRQAVEAAAAADHARQRDFALSGHDSLS